MNMLGKYGLNLKEDYERFSWFVFKDWCFIVSKYLWGV